MREQMVLDEKIIGVELSAQKRTFKWPVQDDEKKGNKTQDEDDDNESNDDMSALQKIFLLQSAVLGVGAKSDQRNLVHLTVKDSTGDKIVLDQPIFSLSLEKKDSISGFNFRLLLTETTDITLKLVEGDGPVHLITSKILEPPFDMGNYSSDDDDDQFDAMSGSSDEDIEESAGDRKAQSMPAGKASKKSKKNPGESMTNNNHSSETQQPKKKRKKDE